MVTFMVTYRFANKGDREKFYAELVANDIDKLCQAEKGNFGYDYYFSAKNENEMFLLEKWENYEAQKMHCTQPHFATIGSIKSKYECKTTIDKFTLS